MSVQALSAVFDSDIGPANKRVVLLAIANRADEVTGLCWPGIDRLAAESQMSRASLFRILTQLEKEGLVSRRRRREDGHQNTNVYKLNIAAVIARKRAPVKSSDMAAMERLFEDEITEEVAPVPDAIPDPEPDPEPGDDAQQSSAVQSRVSRCDPAPDLQEQNEGAEQTCSEVQRLRLRPSRSQPETESVSPVRPKPTGTVTEPALAPLRELHGSLALPGCRETPPLALRGSLPSTNRHATDRGDRLTNSSPKPNHHPRASRATARGGTA